MKKFYSLVLMAAALLIGTNAWAVTRTAGDAESFENAWKAAQNGDVIQLTNDITITKTLWLGTQTMGATAISLTLDLNGKVLENNAAVSHMFVINHGELNVISSIPGGQLIQSNWANSTQEMFRMTGSNLENINPKTATSGYFTHLTIGEGVFVEAQKQNALVVDAIKNGWNISSSNAIAAGGGTVPASAPYDTYGMSVYTGTEAMLSGSNGLANGVRVDIYGNIHGEKYAFKVNGNVRTPVDAQYSPFIYLHGSSDLNVPASNASSKKPVAAYCSGYARWLIEGHCIGSTAVYVKAGEVDINDAVIESNYTGVFVPATAAEGSGVVGCGSAIVVESNKAYSGDIDVEVSGDSKVTATNGYALEEKVTNAPTTKVDNVTISGGSFEGGNVGTTADPKQGTIVISETTASSASDSSKETKIQVVGGMVDGAVQVGNSGNLNDLISTEGDNKAYTTIVTDPTTGKQTVVITEGTEPTVVPNEFEIDNLAAKADVNLSDEALVNKNQVFGDAEDAPEKIEIATLMMAVDNPANAVSLTIKAGHTIEAEKVIMGYAAQIIVEAGAKFIVKGDQGITAPVASNIVLKASESAQATFLFNPAVTSNRHPKATVEFISNSYRLSDGSKYAWQRFGIPAYEKLEDIAIENDIPTAFAALNYATGAWEVIGTLNDGGAELDPSALNNSFGFYQMLHNTPNMGTKVTMKSALVGNIDPELNVEGHSWCGFANSYMATVNGEKLLGMIPDGVEQSFQVYKVTENQAVWQASSNLDCVNIEPMQPFLINNPGAAAKMTIGYKAAVYDQATKANAPARRVAGNMTKAKIIVKGENCVDRVVVAEDAQFSAEFDNGYDASKYMNDGINMYISADKKMAIFATDNLNNTYVGLQTVNGGNYTIEFTDVQGEELTLIDHETGARVAMVEGNAYEFTANGTNDYRFEIVNTVNAPTAIENTEAVKSVKGIYTVTGQYVGEMNVWNTLPTGIYVVNGEKRVK